MELKNNSIKIAIFCAALQPLIITEVTQLLVNQYFFFAAHKVKNHNWPEANQLAVYKGDCEELNFGLP